MRSLLVASLILTAWMFAHSNVRPAEVRPRTGAPAQSDVDSEVRSIVAKRFRVAQAKNISDIAPLYSDDKNLIVFRQGNVVRGWPAYQRYWESALKSLPPGFELQFQNVDVQTTSEMAFVTTLWTTAYKDQSGQRISKKGLMTIVLAAKPGGWHIVHEHISSIDDDAK
jgi:ketosteroid isomerase-like protein